MNAQRVLLGALIIYAGLTASLPKFFNVDLWIISSGLLAFLLIAAAGWTRIRDVPILGGYMKFGVLFAAWVLMSGVAAWKSATMYNSVTTAAWVVVIVPGLVALFEDEAYRRIFIVVFVVGALVYVAVALSRLAMGESMLDARTDPNLPRAALLGVNRNAVSFRILVALPALLFWPRLRTGKLWRYPLAAALVYYLLASGGRGGLLAIAITLLVYAMLQQGLVRRARVLMFVALSGFVVLAGLQITGASSVTIERLIPTLHGEASQDSDDTRVLIVERAWGIGFDNPAFGIGLGNFQGRTDEVLDKATSSRERKVATEADAHNTYAQIFASTGFPGTLTFLALLGSIWMATFRVRHSSDGRVALAVLSGWYALLAFETALGAGAFSSWAVALAIASDVVRREALPTESPVPVGHPVR